MRRVQLRYAESEYFTVICPTAKRQRVGSGLSAKYLIRFSPDIKKVVVVHSNDHATVVLSINCVVARSYFHFHIKFTVSLNKMCHSVFIHNLTIVG